MIHVQDWKTTKMITDEEAIKHKGKQNQCNGLTSLFTFLFTF